MKPGQIIEVAADESIESLAPSTDVSQLRTDLDTALITAIDVAERLKELVPSRSISQVFTKLEEAQLWAFRLAADGEEAV